MKKEFLFLALAVFYFMTSCKKGDENPIIDNPGNASTFVDSRDSKEYKFVKIGNQYWMAQDLDYKKETYFCYDDIASNCNDYSVLYDSLEAASVCPNGWHLPSESEFQKLEKTIGFSDADTAMTGFRGNGIRLKSKAGFNMKKYVGCYSSGTYIYQDLSTFYWLERGGYRRIRIEDDQIYKPNTPALNTARFCVRCIRD